MGKDTIEDTGFVSNVGKRRLKSLILPERKKKKTTEEITVMSVTDNPVNKNEAFECPLCSELIYKPYPNRVKVLIKKIENNYKNYEKEQLEIYEQSVAILRKEGKTVPPFAFVPTGVSENDKRFFCRVHRTELEFKPMAKERRYPESIKFEDISSRIALFEDELKSIINRKTPSTHLDNALQRFEELGTNARKATEVMKVFEEFLPGYYGNTGLGYIMEALDSLFLQTEFLSKDNSSPLTPVEFIQQILVPECGIRLIQQDRNKEITLEEAAAIMEESKEYGSIVNFKAKKNIIRKKVSSQDASLQ